MKRSLLSCMFRGLSIVAALLLMPKALQAVEVEPSNEAKWYFSPGIGWLDFDGGEEVQDSWMLSARLGYDYNEWWGLEGLFYILPQVKENFVGRTRIIDGVIVKDEVSKVENPEDAGFGDTWATGLGIDGVFHFTRWKRLDPFLTLGAAFIWYGEKVNGHNFDPAIRGGGGIMYHINDEWALRGDFRGYLVGNDGNANSMIDFGLAWTWGARVPPKLVAHGGPLDTDRDGLPDVEEEQYKTDPYDPDTDKDGLLDGEEVKTWLTDPLNPDSDYDLLKDGDEVKKYKTNPLERDTDKGGVADGHEVLEDSTNPLDPKDDLMLVELYIQFDYDKADIKPEFFPAINVIGKVMARHPKSTAVIEGHADRTTKSTAEHNKPLSKRRAQSVCKYLTDKWDIAGSRLKAVGFGFDRPKEKPDLKNGNPKNRRVEVYIRGANEDAPVVPMKVEPNVVPPQPK